MQLLKTWGYNKQEVTHYLKLMEDLLRAEAAAKAAAAAAANAAADDKSADTTTPGGTSSDVIESEGTGRAAHASGELSVVATGCSAAEQAQGGSLGASKNGSNSSSSSSLTGILEELSDAARIPSGKAAAAVKKQGTIRFASGDGGSSKDKGDEAADVATVAAVIAKKGAVSKSSSSGAGSGKAGADAKSISRAQSAKGSALAANLQVQRHSNLLLAAAYCLFWLSCHPHAMVVPEMAVR